MPGSGKGPCPKTGTKIKPPSRYLLIYHNAWLFVKRFLKKLSQRTKKRGRGIRFGRRGPARDTGQAFFLAAAAFASRRSVHSVQIGALRNSDE